MIVRKKLAGGLLQTGKVIRAAVNNPGFKRLGKNIQRTLKEALEDQNLAKSATKYEKAGALLKALKNFRKEKFFTKSQKDSAGKAISELKKYQKQKRTEAVEYMRSKSATKNFKGGLIRKRKLAKRGF
tara:strand:- start:133 stop:516 length:384 start_codon:yes stop_codon:yes gene_type:complete